MVYMEGGIMIGVKVVIAASVITTIEEGRHEDQSAPDNGRHDINRKHDFYSLRDPDPSGCDILLSRAYR